MPIVILGRIISGMGGAGIMAMSSIIITGIFTVSSIFARVLIGIKILYPGETLLLGGLT